MMNRIKTVFSFSVLVAAFYVANLTACSPRSPDTVTRAKWYRMDPPREGLRCWYTTNVGNAATFCEPETR